MPPDCLDQAVDVLEELPGEAALADAGRADHRHETCSLLASRRVEEVLELAQLVVAADERRFERLLAIASTGLSDHPERPPGRHGRRLALELLLAGRLER